MMATLQFKISEYLPLIATVVLLCLAAVIEILIEPTQAAQGKAQQREIAEAKQEWQEFWTEIEAAQTIEPTQKQAAKQRKIDSKAIPAGDTAFMRYPRLIKKIAPATQRIFVATALSNSPEQRRRLLANLRKESHPVVRYRALIELARTAMRSGDVQEAVQTARTALGIEVMDPRIRADAHFILGAAYLSQGETKAAENELSKAVADDPAFWNAHWMRLMALQYRLDNAAQRMNTPSCLRATMTMLETLRALPDLARDNTQFRDIAAALRNSRSAGGLVKQLLVGLGFYWSGAPRTAFDAFDAVSAKSGRGMPRACRQLIMEKVLSYRNLADRSLKRGVAKP